MPVTKLTLAFFENTRQTKGARHLYFTYHTVLPHHYFQKNIQTTSTNAISPFLICDVTNRSAEKCTGRQYWFSLSAFSALYAVSTALM